MRLKDKIAIITGGGTGIGAATARLFAAEGARICVFGRRPEPLQTVVAPIRADGGNALAVTGNVSDTADGQRLVDETMQAYDRVDILVSSAGTATLMKAVDTTDELWNSVIDTNLTGTFRVIRAVLPVMSAQQSGCVINVSSVLGQSGMKHTAAYSASKAG
ncbi:MAG TPA: 3-ketoacyl-ACP reductase, partial [Candidatus Latescibacteria bacterium]|nr:3-ketoacyl-ACP reductase [Candidatus Latescibacterota bacterium]